MNPNPWHRLPAQSPFVLPEDAAAVLAFNEGASDNHKLRVDRIPDPFVGHAKAPVVILGNNPGFRTERARFKLEPRFVERLRSNLLHEASDCPFVFFAADIDETHKDWSNRKLKGLLLRFEHGIVARSILAVEHCPYASRRYGGGRVRLPSQAYSFHLVKEAMARKAVIVLTRGRRRWFRDLPELKEYEGLCILGNPQTATISSGNCDRFGEIVQAIEADVTE